MKNPNRILSISLAVVIVAALGCLVYAIAAPKQGEQLTEFYILNAEGEAINYPDQVILADSVELIVGIVNQEQAPTSYRVEIEIDGTLAETIAVATLAHEEQCEEAVSIVLRPSLGRQRIEFWLYKNGESAPYFKDPLHLYINVSQFYLLNAEGRAEDYPSQVALGEPVDLILGIVSDEYGTTNYMVDIMIDDALIKTITTQPLAHCEKWEKPVSVIPQKTGKNQNLEFRIYEEDELGYSLDGVLSLNIKVTELVFFPEGVTGYTEFYILNAEGRAEGYPNQLTLGEPVEVIVGIVSHEYELTSYRLEIKVDGILYELIEIGPLSYWEKWEELVSFTPQSTGARQEVEFWLYEGYKVAPYFETPIHFYIDVTETS